METNFFQVAEITSSDYQKIHLAFVEEERIYLQQAVELELVVGTVNPEIGILEVTEAVTAVGQPFEAIGHHGRIRAVPDVVGDGAVGVESRLSVSVGRNAELGHPPAERFIRT